MPRLLTLLASACLAALSALAGAQAPPLWTGVYNGAGAGTDFDPHMIVDSGGNTYVACIEEGPAGSQQDWAIIKYDPAGVQQWVRHYGNAVTYSNDNPTAVALDSQQNLLVTGIRYNGTGGLDTGTDFDIVVQKYSPAGALLWQRTWDDPLHRQDLAYSVKVDSTDHVVVMGWSTSRSTNANTPDFLNFDFLTLRYDSAGTLLWSKTYNGPDQQPDGGNDMVLDTLGNIYVTGTSNRYSGGSVTDLMTLKYSPAGALLWSSRINGVAGQGTWDNHPRNIRLDAAGNAYVSVWMEQPGQPRDLKLIKYSPGGVVLWTRTWGRALLDEATDMALDSVGNVYICLSSEPVPGKGFPDSDAVLVKFTPDGALAWERTYNGPSDLWDGDGVLSIDAQDNVYLGLQSASITYDYTVLKYSPAGALGWVWKYDAPGRQDDNVYGMAFSGGLLRLTGTTSSGATGMNILTLALNPAIVGATVVPDLSSITLSPSSVAGGQQSTATVRLTAPAPTGGVSMKLSTGNSDAATMQGWLDIPQGQTSGTFVISTQPRTAAVSISATYNAKSVTAVLNVGSATPAPAPISLTVSPTSVTGGTSAVGKVTLSSAAPSGGVVVGLNSSNPVGVCPTFVTVPAGTSSASFTITTKAVSATTPVTFTANANGGFASGTLQVLAGSSTPAPTADTVRVSRAEYVVSKKQLTVEATSTNSSATLKVYVSSTGALIGTLSNRGSGRYGATLTVSSNPVRIVVKSSLGGSATASVVAK